MFLVIFVIVVAAAVLYFVVFLFYFVFFARYRTARVCVRVVVFRVVVVAAVFCEIANTKELCGDCHTHTHIHKSIVLKVCTNARNIANMYVQCTCLALRLCLGPPISSTIVFVSVCVYKCARAPQRVIIVYSVSDVDREWLVSYKLPSIRNQEQQHQHQQSDQKLQDFDLPCIDTI